MEVIARVLVLGFVLARLLCAVPVLYTAEELEVASRDIPSLCGVDTSGAGFWFRHPSIRIDGERVPSPTSFADLSPTLESIITRIANGKRTLIEVKIGSQVFLLKKKPLGEGGTAFIYEMADSDLILKVPKPNAIGIRSLLYERLAAPRVEALSRSHGFFTPKSLYFDARGLFSVKERVDAESLADRLMREGVIRVETGSPPLIHIDKTKILHSTELQTLSHQVEKLLQVRRENPDLKLDLAPDNLFVVRAGEGIGLSLVDIGPSGPKTQRLIDGAQDFDGYLEVAAKQIGRNIELGFRKPVPCEARLPRIPPFYFLRVQ